MKSIFLILAFILFGHPKKICTQIPNCDYAKCPNNTFPISHIIAPTIFPFNGEFTTNMERSVEIIKSFPGYKSSNNKYTFHMTIHCTILSLNF